MYTNVNLHYAFTLFTLQIDILGATFEGLTYPYFDSVSLHGGLMMRETGEICRGLSPFGQNVVELN